MIGVGSASVNEIRSPSSSGWSCRSSSCVTATNGSGAGGSCDAPAGTGRTTPSPWTMPRGGSGPSCGCAAAGNAWRSPESQSPATQARLAAKPQAPRNRVIRTVLLSAYPFGPTCLCHCPPLLLGRPKCRRPLNACGPLGGLSTGRGRPARPGAALQLMPCPTRARAPSLGRARPRRVPVSAAPQGRPWGAAAGTLPPVLAPLLRGAPPALPREHPPVTPFSRQRRVVLQRRGYL